VAAGLPCDLVICRSAAPTRKVMAPTIQAVQAIGWVPLKSITHGEMKNSTPSRAVAPSAGSRSGRASSISASAAVRTPSTIIVVVALSVVVVQIGDRKA
jgi:hypothetical protein